MKHSGLEYGWPPGYLATDEDTAHQLAFTKDLAASTLEHPLEAYHSICKAWCLATGATWSWLWMADQMPCPTELQLVGGFSHGKLPLPPNLVVQNTNTVAAYCLSTQRPCFVSNIKEWRAGANGEFRVGLADFLAAHQCSSFLCLPISSQEPPDPLGTDWRQPAHGAICLHFPGPDGGVLHTPDSILLMAAMTLQYLERGHLAHQRKISVELAQLANSHVGTSGQPASARRRGYVKAVLSLLCREMHVDGASLFYHDRWRNCLECVGTTGMMNHRHHSVASITYNAGEGMTGQCYLTGLPFFSQSHISAGGGEPRYLEITQDGGCLPAAAIYPIPGNPYLAAADEKLKAHGVLRLVRHYDPRLLADRVKFDSLSISTIDLVAREMGVVLGGMAHAIRREEEVRFASHGLGHALVLLDALRSAINRQRKAAASVPSQDGIMDNLVISNDDADDIDLIYTLLRNCKLIGPSMNREKSAIDVLGTIKNLSRLLSRHPCLNEGKKREAILVNAPETLPPLRGVKSEFESAMVQLLINALLHGGKDTFVWVTAGCRQGGLFIDIANGGRGIAEEEVESIFLPGFRGSSGDKSGQGNGLAAALSSIKANGGHLVLASERNPTIFRVSFPLSKG